MGCTKSCHSKHPPKHSDLLFIKVPNPIVTFPKLPWDEYCFTDLQKKIDYIVKASIDDLPPDYWTTMQKLFVVLDGFQFVISQNILKKSYSRKYKDAAQRLTGLGYHTGRLKKSFQTLLHEVTSDDNRSIARSEAFVASQEIVRYFSEEKGSFYRNGFLACPCLILCIGVIRSFSNLWLTDGQRKELKNRETAVLLRYKNKCIEERLDNIKILRARPVSFNDDEDDEAQIRKDVRINDFYDERPAEYILFGYHPSQEMTNTDVTLAGYKAEVKREYEQLFGVLLNDE